MSMPGQKGSNAAHKVEERTTITDPMKANGAEMREQMLSGPGTRVQNKASFGPDRSALFGVYLPMLEAAKNKTVFEDMFGPVLQTQMYVSEAAENCDGKHTNDVLYGKKFVLIYFSSAHVSAARAPQFLPLLRKAYSEYGKGDVEVVFVSDDNDEDAFEDHYGDMPWTAVPFANERVRTKLVTQFGPQPFPLLVVLKDDGSMSRVVTDKGKADLKDNNGDLAKAVQYWDVPMK